MNEKIKRFEAALEKRQDRSLALFWNEVCDSLDGEDDYIADLEWQNFTQQVKHTRFVDLINRNHKMIILAKKTLSQLERMNHGH